MGDYHIDRGYNIDEDTYITELKRSEVRDGSQPDQQKTSKKQDDVEKVTSVITSQHLNDPDYDFGTDINSSGQKPSDSDLYGDQNVWPGEDVEEKTLDQTDLGGRSYSIEKDTYITELKLSEKNGKEGDDEEFHDSVTEHFEKKDLAPLTSEPAPQQPAGDLGYEAKDHESLKEELSLSGDGKQVQLYDDGNANKDNSVVNSQPLEDRGYTIENDTYITELKMQGNPESLNQAQGDANIPELSYDGKKEWDSDKPLDSQIVSSDHKHDWELEKPVDSQALLSDEKHDLEQEKPLDSQAVPGDQKQDGDSEKHLDSQAVPSNQLSERNSENPSNEKAVEIPAEPKPSFSEEPGNHPSSQASEVAFDQKLDSENEKSLENLENPDPEPEKPAENSPVNEPDTLTDDVEEPIMEVRKVTPLESDADQAGVDTAGPVQEAVLEMDAGQPSARTYFEPPVNKPVPYRSLLQEKIEPGQTLIVKGSTIDESVRFTINLHSKSADFSGNDVPLHISVRFDEGKIVMNSFSNGEWGKEERKSNPLKKGDSFDFRIRAHDDRFQVIIDHKEFKDYEHRLPLTSISHLSIDGDLYLNHVHWGGKYYPVPYESGISAGLQVGKSLLIFGAVEKKGKRFNVNLLRRNGDIALHFNPRLDDKVVVRNNLEANEWGNEEREGKIPFEKGMGFDLAITNEAHSFQIYVNGERFAAFAHRVDPNDITGLQIQGDIELTGIQIQ